jgi:hypothetical protein
MIIRPSHVFPARYLLSPTRERYFGARVRAGYSLNPLRYVCEDDRAEKTKWKIMQRKVLFTPTYHRR